MQYPEPLAKLIESYTKLPGIVLYITLLFTLSLAFALVNVNAEQQAKAFQRSGDYLLGNIAITAIAIDGGNRKWFGTNGNGVFLISSDNNTQVQHFTTDNSPLPSDIIMDILVDGSTGRVYFATDKGLCSYLSDATEPATSMTKDNVYAYPNPVRPDYTGPITVVGLTYDAEVKITTANGTLVAEGRSTGGTFTWDGCDSEGRRVASGVYMVHTSTSSGEKGTVCKIAIVN